MFFMPRVFQVMVTEGPGGEETMVYDITLSELQSAMDHWGQEAELIVLGKVRKEFFWSQRIQFIICPMLT